jgi:hypothetical protein
VKKIRFGMAGHISGRPLVDARPIESCILAAVKSEDGLDWAYGRRNLRLP